jgi:hypothetical protein
VQDVARAFRGLSQQPGIANITLDDIDVEPSHVLTIAVAPNECAHCESFIKHEARDGRTDETRCPRQKRYVLLRQGPFPTCARRLMPKPEKARFTERAAVTQKLERKTRT